MGKVISLEQAVAMIPDGAAVGIGGFIGCGHPQEFSVGIEESFLKTGHPNNLTIMFSAGIGDGTDKLGLNKLRSPKDGQSRALRGCGQSPRKQPQACG